ncbi:MAG: hypothetical protein NVS2B3_00400 [Vulcanimicrobiaceae bacterium]
MPQLRTHFSNLDPVDEFAVRLTCVEPDRFCVDIDRSHAFNLTACYHASGYASQDRGQRGRALGGVEGCRMPMQLYAARCEDRRALLGFALARVIDVCRAEPSVREAFVFGSYASGTVGPTSDLDVLVVRETALGIVDRVVDLTLAVGTVAPLDLIVVTPGERDTTFAASSFGRTILASAKRVYAA